MQQQHDNERTSDVVAEKGHLNGNSDHVDDSSKEYEKQDIHKPYANDENLENHQVLWTWKTRIAFTSLCLLYVGSQIPLYFVGASLSFIVEDIGGASKSAWYPVANTLALASAAPFCGYMEDLLGRRYIALLGAVVSTVGIIISGTAHTFGQCVTGMAITGAGSAIGELTALAGVSEIVPVNRRGVALAVVTGFLFPFIPYLMYCEYWSTYGTWRWGMWVALIINGISLVGIALTYFPQSSFTEGARKEVLRKIDWIGGALSIIGLTLFLVALQSGGYTYEWKSAYILCTLLIGILLIIAFVVWEWKIAKYPMIPREIFSGQRIVGLAFFVAFVSGMNFYSILNFFPLTYTTLYEPVPLQIGLKGLGQGAGAVIGAVLFNSLLSVFKNHNKEVLLVACMIMTAFGGAAATLTPFTPKWAAVCAAIACFGVGGVLVPAATIAITVCPDKFIATTVALSLSVRVVGGSIGYSIYYNIFANKLTAKLPAYIAEAVINAGLPLESVKPFVLAVLTAPTTVAEVSGVTPDVIAAATLATRWAYSDSFKYVWYTSIPFGVLACGACLCLGNVRPYLTRRIAVQIGDGH